MTDIVFEALDADSAVTSGTVAASLPRLSVVAMQASGAALIARLSLISVSATGFEHVTGTASISLPALKSQAHGYYALYGDAPESSFTYDGNAVARLALPVAAGQQSFGSVFVPQDGTMEIALPALTVEGVVGLHQMGDVEAALPALSVLASEVAFSGVQARMPLLRVSAQQVLELPTDYFDLVASSGYLAAYAGSTVYIDLEFDADGDLATTERLGIFMASAANAINAFSPSNAMTTSFSEEFGIDDGLGIVLYAIWSSSGVASSTAVATLTLLEQLVESMLLADVVDTRQQALATITEAMIVEDSITNGWSVEMLSSGALNDAVTARARLLASMVSAAAGSVTMTPTLRLIALLPETFDAAYELDTAAHLFAALSEGMNASFSLNLGGVEYTAWVLSTNQRLEDGSPIPAVVEYRNFAFNSFASFNGKYFGANEHGLFELTGDTDDGDEIAAWVRSALNNLGTGRLKRMPSVYFGYTSDGTMVLKVITTVNGQKIEDWYTAREKPADAMRDVRIKVGRGLSSVYWAWELHNKDGADFALDVVELMPVVLDRRVRNGN